MVHVEERVAKNRKRQNVRHIILSTISAVGFLSVAMLAPNALKIFKDLGLIPHKRQREVIKQSRNRLVKQGLLVYRNGLLSLTEKGERWLRGQQYKNWKIKKPVRWDKKWRVLVFDIPERRKNIRDKIRRTICDIGFYLLQDSVWIYPYPCEDLVTLLKADFKIGKELLYFVVEEIEYDKELLVAFGLKRD